jgi:hypothetical protein
LCHVLRKEYGICSSLLAGWEGRFVALLSDSQSTKQTSLGETRCPAGIYLCRRTTNENDKALQYAAAIVMRLFQEKLTDNIRDDKSRLSIWIRSRFKRQFKKATLILRRLDFPIDNFNTLLSQQFDIETMADVHGFNDATEPFSRALGLLTAQTCRIAGTPDNFDLLDKIGRLLGRVITIIDACHDYIRDYKNRRYNVIREASPLIPLDYKLPAYQIENVENYLFLNLKDIRSCTRKLVFHRNAGAVQNILLFGLFDASLHAIQQISRANAYQPMRQFKPIYCTSCGYLIDSRFCPHCGKNRYTAIFMELS